MNWFLLSLLCAFSLATADALSKKFFQDYAADELVLGRFVYSGILLAPWLFAHPPPPVVGFPFWGWVGAAVPLEIIAMLLSMRAVRDCPLSLSQPLLALTPAFTVPAALALLGERVSAIGLAGIAFVVAGTFLLYYDRAHGGWRNVGAPFRAFARQQGAKLMLFVAMIYGITSVMGKAALDYMPASSFGAFYFLFVGTVSATVLLLRRPASGRALLRRPGLQLLAGGLFAVMVYTHYLALETVQASYMIAVKRTSILFSVIYGGLFFGERKLLKCLMAAALMLVGVAMLAREGTAP